MLIHCDLRHRPSCHIPASLDVGTDDGRLPIGVVTVIVVVVVNDDRRRFKISELRNQSLKQLMVC